jgi:hypothetical protein
MRYLIVDTSNTFFRARHAAHRQSDTWDRLGFAMHVTLGSVNKAWRDQKADHVVFCLEGRSWRKDFYEPYKKNRAVARAALTETEQEEDRLFWETFDNLKTYLYEQTNCTVLQQYNGISDELHTLEGIFDKKGKLVIDKKTKEPKKIPDPKWILFEKCMRGDPTDNVFSAYPGVRTKGSKNKVGLMEAYEDRNSKGFNWNNLMLQRWTDHNGEEHRVLDDYERNRILVDLTAQPSDVKQEIVSTIKENAKPKQITMVGAKFLKFCGKYELTRLSEQAQSYSEFLNASYPG